MTPKHPHYDIIQNDPRYRSLEGLPLGESLLDCQGRVVEAWKDMVTDFQQATEEESKYSLLVAHANSLRALVQYLDDIPESEIEALNIPTAIPFYYDVDVTTGKVIPPASLEDTNDFIAPGRFRGIYISDERKNRGFLERRRAANDPWLWALHDHQVARTMLVNEGDEEEANLEGEGMEGLEEEARHNTEIFSHTLDRESQ
jgi:hypothetical protein